MGGAALAAGLTAILALGLVGVPIAPADPASPFAITNADSPDPVASGSQLTYTITVVNTGGAKASNLVLSDQVNGVGGIGVPPQLVLTSSRGSCAQNANLVTCSAGTVEGGGVWVVTIRGIVTAANGTTLNNTASVTGTKSAQNFTSTATATTLVSNGGGSPLADLSISKAGPTSVVVSSLMTYTLTVNNTGNANATDVKVVDTVPAGVTVNSASGTSLFVCGVAGQTVTCTGGAVNQGSNATITIIATSPAGPGTITNTASVDPENTIPESNELNNTSALVDTQVTSTGTSSTLTIDKTDTNLLPDLWDDGAGPDPVSPGGLLTYKILVTNAATTRADDVVMVDGTQGLEAASITVNQVVMNGTVGTFGGCSVLAPQVRCSIRSLNPGGTVVYTVSGQVVASAGSTIFNTATVTGNIKNQGVTNTDSEITTVKPRIDLTVTKADSPDPVCARSWPVTPAHPAPPSPPLLEPPACLGGLTYTFVVGNSGINGATGVVVRDPLPPGTVLDSFSAPDFSGGCSVDGANVLTCSNGAIPAESTRTITIVLVAPPTTGPISNTVTVDPFNAIFEADETNNTATQTTQVVTGIDLTIRKFDNGADAVPPVALPGFDPIATSGTQTYTIIVDNIGTQDAAGIRVRDTLPAGSIFRTASGDHGFTCAHASGVVECVGGSLKGTASEFYFGAPPPGNDKATIIIRVFAQPIVGTMHNEVRVDPLNEIPEANEDNNIAFQDTTVGNGGAGQGAFNQLIISKVQTSPDPNNTARNAVVTYEIRIGNDGTDPAVNVTVRDFLPAGSHYIEATGDHSFLCTQLASFVDCTGGQIPANTPLATGAKITVKAFAPDTPGDYTNQAIVDPLNAIPEGNELDNEAFAITKVRNGGLGAFNDLLIDKSAPGSATPGGSITYTLTVWNEGSDPALNVAVRDVLPAGTTFVSAGDSAPATPGAFTCNHSGGVVNCIGATILQGGIANARHIKIEVKAPNQNVVLTNQAVVDPDNQIPEGNELNNSDSADTTVQSVINLTITKDGPDKASQSEVKEYTIKVKNEKPTSPPGATGQTAFGVEMHDPLPVGLIPLAVDAGSGNNWACQVGENPINVVDCVGDLNPDQEVTITITVFITAENNRSLDNEACVDPANKIAEFNPPGESDNCSTHTTPIVPAPKRHPDLLVEKTGSVAVVKPGDSLTYTIHVSNAGDADAQTPLSVTDTLPTDPTTGQVDFVSVSATSPWNCTESSGVVTCDDGAGGLAAGASIDITIVVTVKPTADSAISNTAVAAAALANPAEADAENETNLDNNHSTVVTSIGAPGFDFVLADIVDAPDPAIRGNQLTYSVIASNAGTDTATGVHISIGIPATGLTFIGAAGTNGFNCGAPAANTIDCVGDLPGGGGTAITVKFIVNLAAPDDDLHVTATIDPANAFTESNEGNNTASETTTVSGAACSMALCADLVAAQLNQSANPVSVGDSVTYTLVVANDGATPITISPADRLVFFDLFGNVSNATPTSSNPAVTCTTFSHNSSSLLNDCSGTLNPGEAVTLTLTVTVNGGTTVTARGWADPNDVIDEFNDHQPRPPDPPVTLGNNVIFKVTTVNP